MELAKLAMLGRFSGKPRAVSVLFASNQPLAFFGGKYAIRKLLLFNDNRSSLGILVDLRALIGPLLCFSFPASKDSFSLPSFSFETVGM